MTIIGAEVTQKMEVNGVALVRSAQTRDRIKQEYQSGRTDKELRSYMLPEYQREIIDLLSEETGESKAGIVRRVFDEWIDAVLSQANGRR